VKYSAAPATNPTASPSTPADPLAGDAPGNYARVPYQIGCETSSTAPSTSPTTIDLGALASLPAVVEQLRARLEELEERLAVAERRPYTVTEAARALGVSEKTIRRRIEAGQIRHAWTGRRVSVYLDR
jgi:excisionase family DNA binding protein